MLFILTGLIDFIGMGLSLWLALYLLGRGFRSRITLRAVVVLLALSAFFLGAYINAHVQIPGTAAVRATLLLVGLSAWCDLTHKLLPVETQKRLRWLVAGVYAFCLVTIVLFWTENSFVGEAGNAISVARMNLGPAYIVYGVSQVIAGAAILYNLNIGAKMGVGRQNRYFLIASMVAVSTVAYGILALAASPPLPRIIQDSLILVSIFILGISVARHQALVERRASWKDFPVSLAAVFILSAIFVLAAWHLYSSPLVILLMGALAILTHSTYDLVREFLERLRSRDENEYRRQFRRLENEAWSSLSLPERLQDGLGLMCQILETSGGFVAVRQGTDFIVSVSHHSIPAGKRWPVEELSFEDICQPPREIAHQVAWIAPGFGGGEQVAVVGIGAPRARYHYSDNDMDLLAEAAERIGTIVYLYSLHPLGQGQLNQMASEMQSHEANLLAKSQALIDTLVHNPDPQFVKMVEEGIRNLSDYIKLGQSSLTQHFGIYGETQIERGKALREILVESIETLRPARERPVEPLPREWYSYVVLHDAYIADIPNSEIMARLYISEGTFNRSRQKALRGIARCLMDRAPRPSSRRLEQMQL